MPCGPGVAFGAAVPARRGELVGDRTGDLVPGAARGHQPCAVDVGGQLVEGGCDCGPRQHVERVEQPGRSVADAYTGGRADRVQGTADSGLGRGLREACQTQVAVGARRDDETERQRPVQRIESRAGQQAGRLCQAGKAAGQAALGGDRLELLAEQWGKGVRRIAADAAQQRLQSACQRDGVAGPGHHEAAVVVRTGAGSRAVDLEFGCRAGAQGHRRGEGQRAGAVAGGDHTVHCRRRIHRADTAQRSVHGEARGVDRAVVEQHTVVGHGGRRVDAAAGRKCERGTGVDGRGAAIGIGAGKDCRTPGSGICDDDAARRARRRVGEDAGERCDVAALVDRVGAGSVEREIVRIDRVRLVRQQGPAQEDRQDRAAQVACEVMRLRRVDRSGTGDDETWRQYADRDLRIDRCSVGRRGSAEKEGERVGLPGDEAQGLGDPVKPADGAIIPESRAAVRSEGWVAGRAIGELRSSGRETRRADRDPAGRDQNAVAHHSRRFQPGILQQVRCGP